MATTILLPSLHADKPATYRKYWYVSIGSIGVQDERELPRASSIYSLDKRLRRHQTKLGHQVILHLLYVLNSLAAEKSYHQWLTAYLTESSHGMRIFRWTLVSTEVCKKLPGRDRSFINSSKAET
jgi:hypothetical protein